MLSLETLLQAARQHSLYKHWPLDAVRSFGDSAWRSLPTLDGDALKAYAPAFLRKGGAGAGYVFYSSGSTSKEPKTLFFSEDDIARIADLCHRFAALEGVNENSRVMVLLPMSLWIVGRITTEGHRKAGAAVYPVDLHGGREHWQLMADEIRPTIISSTPSILHAWAPHYHGPPLELVETTGEPLTLLERQELERRFQAPVHDAYGLTECVVGAECSQHQGFHYWPDATGVEIIDPDTGAVLPPGRTGEIVVTSFMQQSMPILRYRTGDKGRIELTPCPCGCPQPRVFMEGTLEQVMQLGRGVQLTVEEIASALPDGAIADIRWKPTPRSPATHVLGDAYTPILEIVRANAALSADEIRKCIQRNLPHIAELVYEKEVHLSVV